MKKEVLVFIFDGYADWESAYVCTELNAPETEYTVKTFSLDKQAKVSMAGFKVLPDYSVEDFPKQFSLLLLTGGYAWMQQLNDAVLPVVKYAVERNIPVAAICNAANFMAQQGYLDQIAHSGNTVSFMQQQAPRYKGADRFLEKQAVSDKNIITANGSATLEFARDILLLLKAKPEAEIIKWYKMHKDGYYPV
ncbi:MAG: type 1 glutamine amidotransferase family protein [Selenomonadaceae bacterium]